jgi:translation initiation factor 2A
LSLLDEDDTSNSTTAATTPFLKETGRVQIMDISPQGTYLLTWERPPEGETPNLKLWSSATGELVAGFRQKVLRKDNWPYLQWTHDESFAFLLGTNEIKVYPGSTFALKTEEGPRFVDRLKMPGISSLSVPSQSPSAVKIFFATFSPKDKNRPAKAALYEYPAKATTTAGGGGANDAYPAVASKSLFQAEEMSVQWNPKGDVALISLQTNVDTSGQSYYGSTSLFLMSHDQTDAIAVPLPQEGPVLDVAWVPNPSNKGTASAFVVVAGKMPSMASLHNGNDGKATFVFGNAHRNTIAWAPHGRFLCLAGFGNLAGGMTFWDRNKLKQIPPGLGITASCTVGYGWSPDSRMFAVSTTSPRMNVDNGVRVFRYNGDQIMNVSWRNDNYLPDRLLQVTFLPALPTVYPDRPQSPTLKDTVSGAASPTEVTAAPKSAGAYVPPSARVAYVPPSARGGGGIGGRGGGSTLADRMRAEKESSMKSAGKVVEKPKLVVGATGKVIPGLVAAAPAQQGKSKSAQKKEKAKQKKEEEEAKRILEEKAAAAVAPPPASEDPQKRARKINKILKQIDELKQKAASELNDDQKNKIDSEAELRQELSSLGL